jgi:small subunit ribosomal protein S18
VCDERRTWGRPRPRQEGRQGQGEGGAPPRRILPPAPRLQVLRGQDRLHQLHKIDYINYKDVRLLSPFIPERGKIQPRRISGTCAKHQRALQTAISRARQLALIPYVTD